MDQNRIQAINAYKYFWYARQANDTQFILFTGAAAKAGCDNWTIDDDRFLELLFRYFGPEYQKTLSVEDMTRIDSAVPKDVVDAIRIEEAEARRQEARKNAHELVSEMTKRRPQVEGLTETMQKQTETAAQEALLNNKDPVPIVAAAISVPPPSKEDAVRTPVIRFQKWDRFYKEAAKRTDVPLPAAYASARLAIDDAPISQEQKDSLAFDTVALSIGEAHASPNQSIVQRSFTVFPAGPKAATAEMREKAAAILKDGVQKDVGRIVDRILADEQSLETFTRSITEKLGATLADSVFVRDILTNLRKNTGPTAAARSAGTNVVSDVIGTIFSKPSQQSLEDGLRRYIEASIMRESIKAGTTGGPALPWQPTATQTQTAPPSTEAVYFMTMMRDPGSRRVFLTEALKDVRSWASSLFSDATRNELAKKLGLAAGSAGKKGFLGFIGRLLGSIGVRTAAGAAGAGAGGAAAGTVFAGPVGTIVGFVLGSVILPAARKIGRWFVSGITEGRFLPGIQAITQAVAGGPQSPQKPYYKSPWFWGFIVLLAGFLLLGQDTVRKTVTLRNTAQFAPVGGNAPGGPLDPNAAYGFRVYWTYAGDPPISSITSCPVSGGSITQYPGESFSHTNADAYDFGLPDGAPIFASHDAYVVSCYDGYDPHTFLNRSYGNYVLLAGKTPTTGETFFTMYAHLLTVDPVIVSALGGPCDGAQHGGTGLITAGTQIGTNDATGSTYGRNEDGTGSHLHFEYQGPGTLTLPAGCP